MQWLTVAWWRYRLAQALARNPVVRTSDRIEVVVMALAVALSLAAMPVALAIGTAVRDEHARAYTAEQHDRHRVVATATEGSASSPSGAVAVVQTRSQVSDVENAGAFTWQSPVKDGSSIDIWVDRHGRQVGPPTQSGRRVPTPLSLRWGSGCRFPQRLRCSCSRSTVSETRPLCRMES